MVLSDISIKRPVLATVMSLLIILLGVISFDRLAVREYPKIDPPTVSVRTVYKGATAQVVESVITVPVEDALSGIEGIKTIKSKSREEVSEITVTFQTSRDVEAAANDVRDRVARVKAQLPRTAMDPVVSKIEADAWPIMWIALSSDRHSPMELTDYADRFLTDPLKALPGVATVVIGGERTEPADRFDRRVVLSLCIVAWSAATRAISAWISASAGERSCTSRSRRGPASGSFVASTASRTRLS
jgi:multidrug efflux pump